MDCGNDKDKSIQPNSLLSPKALTPMRRQSCPMPHGEKYRSKTIVGWPNTVWFWFGGKIIAVKEHSCRFSNDEILNRPIHLTWYKPSQLRMVGHSRALAVMRAISS